MGRNFCSPRVECITATTTAAKCRVAAGSRSVEPSQERAQNGAKRQSAGQRGGLGRAVRAADESQLGERVRSADYRREQQNKPIFCVFAHARCARWPRVYLDRKWRRLGRRCSQKVLEHRRSHFSASSPQLLRVCGNSVYALPQSVCALRRCPAPVTPPLTTHGLLHTRNTTQVPSAKRPQSDRGSPP